MMGRRREQGHYRPGTAKETAQPFGSLKCQVRGEKTGGTVGITAPTLAVRAHPCIPRPRNPVCTDA